MDDLFATSQPEEATRVMNILGQSMVARAEVHFVLLLSLDILSGSCAGVNESKLTHQHLLVAIDIAIHSSSNATIF